MPTIYEYLNSISDFLVPMERDYAGVSITYSNSYSENLRYTVRLTTGDKYTGSIHGFGPTPAEAYNNAKQKLLEFNTSREAQAIREKYAQLAAEEIASLGREPTPIDLDDEVPF